MITIVNSAVVSVSVLKSTKVSMVDQMGVIGIVISLVRPKCAVTRAQNYNASLKFRKI